ncbi:unnamed protein product [Prorocentrum cordatum]|uniref:Rab-GAP TBC domain-containing protein n=1 Tax=Prorocentrum cordatum TaxID=2364126 RepID=A0ABN9XHS5_9DINO|nr:unnamed protein product [Polarella glacialis]
MEATTALTMCSAPPSPLASGGVAYSPSAASRAAGPSVSSEATAARYGEMMSALEAAVTRSEFEQAQAIHSRLAAFVRTLDWSERTALEGLWLMPGWNNGRIMRLHSRWQALKIHRGCWSEWCSHLQSEGAWQGAVTPFSLRESARDLVYLAPPGPHRAELWRFCAGSAQHHDSAQVVVSDSEPQISPNEAEKDPDSPMVLDIERTPNLEEEQRGVLQRVLRAHFKRRGAALPEGNKGEHYVQGMHLLAACPIWAGLEPAQALQVFEYVLDGLCAGYYRDVAFRAFKRDVHVVEALVADRLPRLAKALDIGGVPVMLLAFDPLLCLFALYLPRAVVLRVWDVLLLEGAVAIFAVLLVLLELLLPEAVHPRGAGEPEPCWTSFPFVERFHERSAALTPHQAEAVIKMVRSMLEGQDRDQVQGAGTGLRQRVLDLRREAVAAEAGQLSPARQRADSAWWDQAMEQAMQQAAEAMDQVRLWWRSASDADSVLSPAQSPFGSGRRAGWPVDLGGRPPQPPAQPRAPPSPAGASPAAAEGPCPQM